MRFLFYLMCNQHFVTRYRGKCISLQTGQYSGSAISLPLPRVPPLIFEFCLYNRQSNRVSSASLVRTTGLTFFFFPPPNLNKVFRLWFFLHSSAGKQNWTLGWGSTMLLWAPVRSFARGDETRRVERSHVGAHSCLAVGGCQFTLAAFSRRRLQEMSGD